MNQPERKTPAPPQTNWPFAFCCFAALPLELLLHDVRSFGTRTVGSRAFGSVLVMFFIMACYQDCNVVPLGCLLIITIVLSVFAQLCATIRKWRGRICHTRYTGKPYISIIFPRSETVVKGLEPLVALFAGVFVHAINRPLGTFVLVSAVCLGLIVAAQYTSMNGRSDDIQDALIDQTAAMKSVRR